LDGVNILCHSSHGLFVCFHPS